MPTTQTTTIESTYNALDQVVTSSEYAMDDDMVFDHGTRKSTYDAAGNLESGCFWNPGATVGACLPASAIPYANQPTQLTTTTSDARNQRVSQAVLIGTAASQTATTTYDPDHNYQPAAAYVPTGSGKEHQTTYGYDERHRLETITQVHCATAQHPCTGGNILSATGSDVYAYDDNDNRTQVLEHNGAASTDRRYCYDALDQLTYRNTGAPCSPSAKDEAYTFDASGNRETALAGGTTTTFTYATGQLASCTGSTCGTVDHDDAGNTTRLGAWAYEYDQEGRLTKACKAASCATGTADRVEFAYDGEGHRTEIRESPGGTLATTTAFRYAGDTIAEVTVNGTVTRSYLTDDAGTIVRVCDPTCTSPTASYLPVWNGHGDATALYRINTDGTLTLANSFGYGTWGSSLVTIHNGIGDLGFRFRYVGARDVQWDDQLGLGLTYMHARHYSPGSGRFLQPDPARAEENNASQPCRGKANGHGERAYYMRVTRT